MYLFSSLRPRREISNRKAFSSGKLFGIHTNVCNQYSCAAVSAELEKSYNWLNNLFTINSFILKCAILLPFTLNNMAGVFARPSRPFPHQDLAVCHLFGWSCIFHVIVWIFNCLAKQNIGHLILHLKKVANRMYLWRKRQIGYQFKERCE